MAPIENHTLSRRQLRVGDLHFDTLIAGSVRDPFGHVWVLLSWKEDPDAAEIERRGAALLSQ